MFLLEQKYTLILHQSILCNIYYIEYNARVYSVYINTNARMYLLFI
jgi:hypothetical protein